MEERSEPLRKEFLWFSLTLSAEPSRVVWRLFVTLVQRLLSAVHGGLPHPVGYDKGFPTHCYFRYFGARKWHKMSRVQT